MKINEIENRKTIKEINKSSIWEDQQKCKSYSRLPREKDFQQLKMVMKEEVCIQTLEN